MATATNNASVSTGQAWSPRAVGSLPGKPQLDVVIMRAGAVLSRFYLLDNYRYSSIPGGGGRSSDPPLNDASSQSEFVDA
ncbi:hypothetical protein [Gordonia effusa]|uniref:hypothetical protein n=1 Tax=Gordonia effusa TaxID=263908 RepID=UPI000314913A|nr:hypothetical protein [Gordonia effusa]